MQNRGLKGGGVLPGFAWMRVEKLVCRIKKCRPIWERHLIRNCQTLFYCDFDFSRDRRVIRNMVSLGEQSADAVLASV